MPLHFIGCSESCNSEEFGSQEFLLDDLKKFHNVTKQLKTPILTFVNKLTYNKFKISQRTPIVHLCNLFERPIDINWSENPGLPWITNGFKTRNDIRNDAKSVAAVRRFWHYIKLGENTEFPDCIPNNRDKRGLTELKWIYPATIIFGEAMFAFPLLQYYKSLTYHKTPLIQVFKSAENGPKKLKERFERDFLYYYLLEFPNFHKKVPAWLISNAVDILSLNMDYVHYDDYGLPRGLPRAGYMIRMFKKIKGYIINTTYRTPNGKRYKKNNGIPIESYFAPLICAVINHIIINYAILKIGCGFFFDTIFLGYGSLVTTTTPLDMDGFSKVMIESFGIELDLKCSKVTININKLDLVNMLKKSY